MGTFWYQALWRHNTPLFFYEFYNHFVSVFKRLLSDENTSRISDQATRFLEKRGKIEQMENHNVIRIFCSKENPCFLPYHVSDKLFITEVGRKYNFWLHFFYEKKKKKSIPLPWSDLGRYRWPPTYSTGSKNSFPPWQFFGSFSGYKLSGLF
jgi:hypothetical protein